MPLPTLDLPVAALTDVLQTIVMVLFILSALLLSVVVLLQEGKGGGLSGAFGGAGADAFGVKAGAVNKFTAWLGAAFLGFALLHAGLVSASGTLSLDDTSDTPATGSLVPRDGDEDDGGAPAGDPKDGEDKDDAAGEAEGDPPKAPDDKPKAPDGDGEKPADPPKEPAPAPGGDG